MFIERYMSATEQKKSIMVEINSDYAENILYNLEKLNAIRVLIPENIKPESKVKLSERFGGCLSKKRVESLQQEFQIMRNEWDRNI